MKTLTLSIQSDMSPGLGVSVEVASIKEVRGKSELLVRSIVKALEMYPDEIFGVDHQGWPGLEYKN